MAETPLRIWKMAAAADVVLLDWRMPNLTGIEVLRRMRRAGITIPVIFLTVLSDDIYEEAALEGGAVDFIDKSRRLPILLKRLELIAEGTRPSVDLGSAERCIAPPRPARAALRREPGGVGRANDRPHSDRIQDCHAVSREGGAGRRLSRDI